MIRRAAAVVLALTINPALVSAQDAASFTVTAQSADVYKGPTTVTPVIGQAPRGTLLPVTRNLGSWAKVAWPDAPDGVGYVHLTMGRLAGSKTVALAASTASRTSADSGPSASAAVPATITRELPREQMAVSDQATGAPITHLFGVGGRVGSTRNFGATARVWRNDRVGLQFALTRDEMTSSLAAGRVTSLQAESGVVYALFDHVSDYFWVRPYVGSGVSFHRQTLKVSSPDGAAVPADNGWGYRAFAGSEVTFAGAQRFGLSVEAGYRRVPTPFAGFEPKKLSASLAGHWYLR